MLKHLIKISLLGVLLSIAAGCLVVLRPELLPEYLMLFSALLIIGIASLIYLLVRVLNFRRKLISFFNYLLVGNYETGIRPGIIFKDEIEALVKLINKAADRLRIYDRLRAERVKFSFRMVEALCKNGREAIITVDMKKSVFQLNPPAQSFFGVRQESFTLGSLDKLRENNGFISYLKRIVEEEKLPREAGIVLRLPGSESAKEAAARIIPLKDRNEKVRSIIIFVDKRT